MLTLVDECRLGFMLSTFQPGGIHELELMPFEDLHRYCDHSLPLNLDEFQRTMWSS